jgi:hypothetical protein
MRQDASNMMVVLFLIVCLTIVVSTVVVATSSSVTAIQEKNTTLTNESEFGSYNIKIKIDKSNDSASAEYTELNETDIPGTPLLVVDGHRFSKESSELEVGETWTATWDLNETYNVTKEQHRVGVYTFGPELETTTERKFNLTDPDIPATRIKNVEVVETTYQGESRAAVDIVLENPSPRAYSGYIYAHTVETHGDRASGTVPIDEKTDVTRIILRERPDQEIEGELRLTTEDLDEAEGLRDQVWFRGTVDGDTEWQREQYEPVGYRNSEDPYRYSKDEGIIEKVDDWSLPVKSAIGLVVVVLVVSFVGRRRPW